MNTNANGKKGLTIRDPVTIGIFSALFLVFALVGGIFFRPQSGADVLHARGQRPVVRAGVSADAGPGEKARRREPAGGADVPGVVCNGMHWAMALGYLVMGVAAYFTAGAGKYENRKLNALS